MKPDELYDIIESCSPGPYVELFARFKRTGWSHWGNEVDMNGKQIKVYATYRGNEMQNGSSGRRQKESKRASLFD
jgi:N6-adenosine-specific RNA methylase IME4